jgi:hypothetical protein
MSRSFVETERTHFSSWLGGTGGGEEDRLATSTLVLQSLMFQ